MSDSWVEHFSTYQPGATAIGGLGRWIARLAQILKESPFVFTFLFFPYLLARGNKLEKWLSAAAMICIVFFIFGMGSHTELRHLGLCLPFLLTFSLAALLSRLPIKWRSWSWVLVIPTLALSHLPIHILLKSSTWTWSDEKILSHTAGRAKAWVRQNISASGKEKVALIADNEIYYLTDWPVLILSEYTPLDRSVRNLKSLTQYCRALSDFPDVKYLLDARPNMGFSEQFKNEKINLGIEFAGDGIIYSVEKICSRNK
jgi:hypothetical protein